MALIIRDFFATINGDNTVYELPSGGLEIVADDGRTLYSLRLRGQVLEVSAGSFCKHEGIVLSGTVTIRPRASNLVLIERDAWEKKERPNETD